MELPNKNDKKVSSEIKETVLSQDPETMEANMKLQDAFYNDGGNTSDLAPNYAAQNNTPAIKIDAKE